MFNRTVSPEDLGRLKREREEADRLYNEALTALDQAIQRLPVIPNPPPAFDEHQLTSLNQLWSLSHENGRDRSQGWKVRLKALVWRVVRPFFARQQRFNSALVDHINRNVGVHRETQRVIETTLAVINEQLAALVAFQSRLILYVQQITPYVDTKDREVAGLTRRINEDIGEIADRLDHRTVGLAAGIGGVSDELQKRWESMVARERRYEARVGEVDEMRSTLAVAHQASLSLKRELERLMAAGQPELSPQSSVPGPNVAPSPQPLASGLRPLAPGLDSYKYVGFEDQFRGSQEEIRARVAEYVPYFEGASDVLDVGCGRGEFLDLLRESGIGGRGLDINHAMVEVCRARGLAADERDALTYISALPDGSLGGFFAAQVVEHLQPDYLLQLLETAYHKLRPGSKIVLETINPACWFAFFESYIRDITHVRPLHPDTLKYLLIASGFQRIDTRYLVPYPDQSKLRPIAVPPDGPKATGDGGALPELALTFNENVTKLNRLLFTHLDYAVIGERL